jgi:hypothetical protein
VNCWFNLPVTVRYVYSVQKSSTDRCIIQVFTDDLSLQDPDSFFLIAFYLLRPVLRIRIRDPGLGALTPGSGIREGRKSASGSEIRDEQPGSYFLELRNHYFAFLGSKYYSLMRIRDPGWRHFGSGIRDGKIRIRDKHPGSATLLETDENEP